MNEPMTDERPSCLCSCTPEIDRLRAELAAREAECERLLRENLELKMRPVFDEYRP